MHAIRTGVVLALLACAIGACAPAPEATNSPELALPSASAITPEATVALDGIEVRVALADSADERSRGLQGYDPLRPGEGMLFIFDDVEPRVFVMKDVAFPIDIVYIAEDGTVSAIEPLNPGDTRLVASPGPSRYVLELPQGWSGNEGITVGSAFEVTGE